jgi:predicted DNA-binding ribbon-helix-helix protein
MQKVEKMETIELELDNDVYEALVKIAEEEKMSFDELVAKILKDKMAKEKFAAKMEKKNAKSRRKGGESKKVSGRSKAKGKS